MTLTTPTHSDGVVCKSLVVKGLNCFDKLVAGGLSGKCRALLLAGKAGGIAAVLAAEAGDKSRCQESSQVHGGAALQRGQIYMKGEDVVCM